MHDALDHMESLLTLFNLGHIDLQDRSNAEILVHQIIKKSLYPQDNPLPDIERLQVKLQERYLINIRFFQSIPDYWGLQQQFPIMPLDRLTFRQSVPHRYGISPVTATGRFGLSRKTPLYLHDIDLDEEGVFSRLFQSPAPIKRHSG